MDYEHHSLLAEWPYIGIRESKQAGLVMVRPNGAISYAVSAVTKDWLVAQYDAGQLLLALCTNGRMTLMPLTRGDIDRHYGCQEVIQELRSVLFLRAGRGNVAP